MMASATAASAAAAAFDLVVVGSGIVGLSHAAAAAARGLRVAVIERTTAPAGATVRNFGLLTSLYAGGPWGHRATRSRQLYASWAARGGVQLTKTGTLQLLQSPAQLRLASLYAGDVGPSTARLLTPDEAYAMAPGLAPPARGGVVLGALLLPNDALLEPRLLPRTLPCMLAEQDGVTFVACDAAVAVEPASGGAALAALGGGRPPRGVTVRTAGGRALTGTHAVLATGDDAVGLLPGLLHEEAPKLSLCKLQMARLALPPSGGGIPLPVTSGLTLRRYPALAAVRPAEHAAMMAHDPEGADPAAEALGIHIIARPAPAVPRGRFGEVLHDALAGGGGAPMPLTPLEVVLGDTHQYAPLYGAGSGALDDTVDEDVTDEMLRVAGTMLDGVETLRQVRRKGAPGGPGAARLLSQWTGVYMQHEDGVLNATVALAGRGGPALGGPGYARVTPADLPAAAAEGGLVHVCTGIGGKGMTMSPALGEENVAALFGEVRRET